MVTMHCPHCGYAVAEGQTTCSQCERPITAGTTEVGGTAGATGSRQSLKYLPNEADRGEFRTINESFKVTTKRLIFEGESKRLLVLPGGRALAAAMLEDVDLAFLGRKHVLPVWVGLLGVAVVLAALGAESGFGVIIGGAIVAAWYFLGSTVLEFKVHGEPLGTMTVVSAGGVDQELANARGFVDTVFEAKAESTQPS